MLPLTLSDFSIVTCVGAGRDANAVALCEGRSGLRPSTFAHLPFKTYSGEVAELDERPLQGRLSEFDCRNNRLAALALSQDNFITSVETAKDRYGGERIGLFLGTSTSGLLQTELAYQHRNRHNGLLPPGFDYARTHNTYALGRFVRSALQLGGPAFVVSTACAATAKVFGNAARMIATGVCDAAIVGGADTLCATTLCGFRSLGVMSDVPCRPFDVDRQGISIGEAAGFVLLERTSPRLLKDSVLLLGIGESSDAYHMSSPHPHGVGARLAMERALGSSGLSAKDIHYINLHGTATPIGDAAEDRAVFDVFGSTAPCSSTKGLTGHTLGASGVIEAAFCALSILRGFVPGSPHTKRVDPTFRCQYMREGRPGRIDRAISNSFGFGGANCSLILGRAG